MEISKIVEKTSPRSLCSELVDQVLNLGSGEILVRVNTACGSQTMSWCGIRKTKKNSKSWARKRSLVLEMRSWDYAPISCSLKTGSCQIRSGSKYVSSTETNHRKPISITAAFVADECAKFLWT